MTKAAWVIISGGVVQETSSGGVEVFDYDDIADLDMSDLASRLEAAVDAGCEPATHRYAELIRERADEAVAKFSRGNGLPDA